MSDAAPENAGDALPSPRAAPGWRIWLGFYLGLAAVRALALALCAWAAGGFDGGLGFVALWTLLFVPVQGVFVAPDLRGGCWVRVDGFLLRSAEARGSLVHGDVVGVRIVGQLRELDHGAGP